MLLLALLLSTALAHEEADVVLAFDDTHTQELHARYTPSSQNRQSVSGFMAQTTPSEPCNAASKIDLSLTNYIVLLNYSGVPSFMAGCISVKNQVNFAVDSGARAILLIGTDSLSPQAKLHADVPIPVLEMDRWNAMLLQGVLQYSKLKEMSLHVVFRQRSRPPITDNTDPIAHYPSPTHFRFSSRLGIDLVILISVLTTILLIGVLISIYLRRTQLLNAARQLEEGTGGLKINKRTASVEKLLHATISALPIKRPVPRSQRPRSLRSDQRQCVICLLSYSQNDTNRVLPCKHEFHAECIDRWLIVENTCPLCKFDILHSQRADEPPVVVPTNKNMVCVSTTEAQPLLHQHDLVLLPPTAAPEIPVIPPNRMADIYAKLRRHQQKQRAHAARRAQRLPKDCYEASSSSAVVVDE